jgi:prophage regulatory protein
MQNGNGVTPEGYLRPRDAASFLGVSQSTFWHYAKTRPGFPEARRLSLHCTVYSKAELAGYADSLAGLPPANGRRGRPGKLPEAAR